MRMMIAALAVIAAPAYAFGLSGPFVPTTGDDDPELSGTQIDILQSQFSTPGQANTLQSTVVREAGTGMLDFYYVVPPIAALPPDEGGITIAFLTNASIHPFPAAVAKEFLYVTSDPNATPMAGDDSAPANVLDFSPTVGDAFFVVRTDATTIGTGTLDFVFSDGLTGSVAVLVPEAVPEPASVGLLGLAVGGLGLRLRRRV